MLEARTRRLVVGLEAAAQQAGVALATNQIGGMFGFFFTSDTPVWSY